jgi:hypothetical protein
MLGLKIPDAQNRANKDADALPGTSVDLTTLHSPASANTQGQKSSDPTVDSHFIVIHLSFCPLINHFVGDFNCADMFSRYISAATPVVTIWSNI